MKIKTLLPAIVAGVLSIMPSCRPETYGPLPSEEQLAWADMEYYMFCHSLVILHEESWTITFSILHNMST